MKPNKRFMSEFGTMVNPGFEFDHFVPWLLDRMILGSVILFMMTIGAMIEYFLPLSIWVLAGLSALGITMWLTSCVVVLIADASDEHDDTGYPGS